ncbi:WXG100 family type VII secretion target [Mycolicibacterium senegalense]|uniref:WXG100 family type VII secretion target n=1 Tax=Mycobacteriaceae TaxID=1762 RepID=UPI003AAC48E2
MTDVLYNYAGIEGCISEMTQVHQTATALKMTGIAHKQSLAGTWNGSSHMSFEDAFNKYIAVNEKVEEASGRVIAALSNGTQSMQGAEQAMSATF